VNPRPARIIIKRGQDKETLIVFTSDNGGQLAVGARNGPVRGGKTMNYQGGLLVSTCVVRPGKIKPGTRSDFRALTMDFYPTLVDAVGGKIEHPIEGTTFLPTLFGRKQAPFARDDFFTWLQGWRKDALRRGDWKLLKEKDKPWELYNLKDDPKETTDLAKKNPEKFKEMMATMDAYLERANSINWKRPSQLK